MQFDERARDAFSDLTVSEVGADQSGNAWQLSFMDSAGLWLNREDFDVDVPRDLVPREGDTVRLYGSFPGIHGVDLNGRRLWYRTQAERFDRERDALDAKVAGLSAPLRAFIERCRSEDPNFRVAWEAYALVACVDADRIAVLLRHEHGWADDQIVPGEDAEEAVHAFEDLPWSEQRARIPELDDGHTGNTFRGACKLAFALLTGQRV